jgi:hypothetical protein
MHDLTNFDGRLGKGKGLAFFAKSPTLNMLNRFCSFSSRGGKAPDDGKDTREDW